MKYDDYKICDAAIAEIRCVLSKDKFTVGDIMQSDASAAYLLLEKLQVEIDKLFKD